MGTMNEMQILDFTGHSKTMWDADNEEEVAAAKSTYDALTKKGYKAFRVKKGGAEGEPMKTFDPEAEKMIMVPPVAGG